MNTATKGAGLRRTTAAAIVVAVVLGLAVNVLDAALVTGRTPPGLIGFSIVAGAVAVFFATLGTMVLRRDRRNTIGWLFSAAGVILVISGVASEIAVPLLRHDPHGVVGLAFGWIANWTVYPAVAVVPFVFLLFPDGRPPTRRARILLWVMAASVAAAILGAALNPDPSMNNFVEWGIVVPNPVSLPFGVDWLIGVGTVLTLVCAVLSVGVLRGRYKRGEGEERQQIRWLAAVGTLAAIELVLGFLLTFLGAALLPKSAQDAPIFAAIVIALAVTLAFGMPLACTVAILKYRLFDLDIVIRKAVVGAIVVVTLVGAYLSLAVGLPLLVAGSGGSISPAPVLLGVAIGLLFVPVRTRARRLADRFVYGGRATPYEVLTDFSGRIGETYSTDDVLPRMAQLLAAGVGADRSTVWLKQGAELRAVAGWPEPPAGLSLKMTGDTLPNFEGETAVEVRHQGELLGALAVAMPANDPMDPAKERLVRDLAAQAGLVLRNVRLIDDLRSSRQRLVAAQDEERRRIERNIHDGAQQQLVALAVQLKLLRTMIERDPAKAIDLAGSLQAASTTALEDLRDLARGIYPPLLADKGLVVALEGQARKAALPVSVNAQDVDRYSPDVEATAYFCVLEALNNIAKYANASAATVTLAQTDGHLEFVVTDDGEGFDANETAYGTGLQGMRDRLDAIGGSLGVESAPGAGTTVRGRLPV